jgi:hypothetical protein
MFYLTVMTNVKQQQVLTLQMFYLEQKTVVGFACLTNRAPVP